MSNGCWVLQVNIEHTMPKIAYNNLQNGVPNNVTTVSSVDQKVSLLAKLGYLINNKTLLFVTGGYSTTEMMRNYDQRIARQKRKA